MRPPERVDTADISEQDTGVAQSVEMRLARYRGMFNMPARQTRWISSPALSRALWASMALLHAPALAASWKRFVQSGLDWGLLGGCLGLGAAMLFFVLKLWGVRFLRFRTDRRSLAVMAVAVALLHADAIGARLGLAVMPKELPVAGTTLLALGLTRVQSVMKATLSRGRGMAKRRILAVAPNEAAWLGAFVPHGRVLSSPLCIPRAPPA